MNVFLFFIIFISMGACTRFIEMIDDGNHYVENLNLDKEHLSIVFSHNISGETHPCGCRHLPLGGLAQVAGLFHHLKDKNNFIYVDTGDAFFPSITIPPTMESSLKFTALNIAKYFNDIGLNYFVPGDQDFAAGVDFLKEIAQNAKYKFLVANFSNISPIPHEKWALIKKGPHKIFLTGLVAPEIMPDNYRNLFTDKYEALNQIIKIIKEKGYSEKDPFHRLIILSHAGLKPDEELAKKYPNIDWVIGAHSQSFFREPYPEGKSKIVQVLSRNHYVGEITISLTENKEKDSYKIHEIRDALKDNIKPNPWLAFIDKHKEDLSKVQLEEQRAQFGTEDNQKFETAASCIDCHASQGDKWQKTAHSIAYHTLVKAGEANNLQCINCHALGTNDPRGFYGVDDMVLFNKEQNAQNLKKYWQDVAHAFKDTPTVRNMSEVQILKQSSAWAQVDKKYNVTHNFANVQCQNCHDQHPQHPFVIGEQKITHESRLQNIKTKCLHCHNSDQSPEWYLEDSRGVRTDINEAFFKEQIKKIACPKQES